MINSMKVIFLVMDGAKHQAGHQAEIIQIAEYLGICSLERDMGTTAVRAMEAGTTGMGLAVSHVPCYRNNNGNHPTCCTFSYGRQADDSPEAIPGGKNPPLSHSPGSPWGEAQWVPECCMKALHPHDTPGADHIFLGSCWVLGCPDSPREDTCSRLCDREFTQEAT